MRDSVGWTLLRRRHVTSATCIRDSVDQKERRERSFREERRKQPLGFSSSSLGKPVHSHRSPSPSAGQSESTKQPSSVAAGAKVGLGHVAVLMFCIYRDKLRLFDSSVATSKGLLAKLCLRSRLSWRRWRRHLSQVNLLPPKRRSIPRCRKEVLHHVSHRRTLLQHRQ